MPTFGKTSNGASSSASTTNKTIVSKHTAPENGILEDIRARIWIDSGSAVTRGVVYADSAGEPGAKLAESDEATLIGTTEAERTFTCSGANRINIVGGTDYWLGVAWQDPGAPNVNHSRDGTTAMRREVNSYAPTPFGVGTSLTGPIDAYVTYSLPAATNKGGFFAFF